MRAAEKRHLIAVEQAVDVQDATGDPIRSWLAIKNVPASIEPLKGNELLRAAAIVSEMNVRVRFDWAPAYKLLDAKWRLRDIDRGTIFNIESVAELNLQQREFEVMCSSGLNLG